MSTMLRVEYPVIVRPAYVTEGTTNRKPYDPRIKAVNL